MLLFLLSDSNDSFFPLSPHRSCPGTCKASFPDEDKLHHFQLAVSPGKKIRKSVYIPL